MKTKLAEPCMAPVYVASMSFGGADPNEGRPCGRPKGHGPERGQCAGGHAWEPLGATTVKDGDYPADRPTVKVVRKVVWTREDARLIVMEP